MTSFSDPLIKLINPLYLTFSSRSHRLLSHSIIIMMLSFHFILLFYLIISSSFFYSGNSFVVEFLKQNLFCKDLSRFFEYDREIWTSFLKTQNGFVSKDYWLDPSESKYLTGNCTVYQHITWTSRELWKSISQVDLAQVDEEFVKAFGYDPIITALPTDEGFNVLP